MNRNDAIIEVMDGGLANELQVGIHWISGDELAYEFDNMDYLDILLVGKKSGKIDKNDEYFSCKDDQFQTYSKNEVIAYFENELRNEIDEDDYQALCEQVEELMREE